MIVLHVLYFTFLAGRREYKNSELNGSRHQSCSIKYVVFDQTNNLQSLKNIPYHGFALSRLSHLTP
jgi:hypothetical protein